MTVAVELSGVEVRLGGAPVLRDLSLEVAPGEFVTLVGPSGSGKTTLLNLVAGFLRPHRGLVRIDGDPVDGIPPERRDIGVVFQGYALFPHLSVAENVGFPLRARRVDATDRRRRVDEALALVRMEGLENRAVRHLSGGQRQRVALARALVFRPRVLLLDEPLGALDQGLRQSMQLELKRIQAEVGVTTIAVTHDQSEALTMSDRVAVLHLGRIEQVGTPEELYRRPANLFVAAFLGESSVLEMVDGRLQGFGLCRPGSAGGLAVLRPEDLGIREAGDVGQGACAGRIEAIDFQGARYRVLVAVCDGGARLVVSLPGTVDAAALRAGTSVTVVCRDPSRLHVIPPQG